MREHVTGRVWGCAVDPTATRWSCPGPERVPALVEALKRGDVEAEEFVASHLLSENDVVTLGAVALLDGFERHRRWQMVREFIDLEALTRPRGFIDLEAIGQERSRADRVEGGR